MAQGNNSIKKVLIVAFSLCIVCSVIVSTAAVALRPAQQLNQELDRKTNILNVACGRSVQQPDHCARRRTRNR